MTLDQIELTLYEGTPFVTLANRPNHQASPEEQFLALLQAHSKVIETIERFEKVLVRRQEGAIPGPHWVSSLLTTRLATYEICRQRLMEEIVEFQVTTGLTYTPIRSPK